MTKLEEKQIDRGQREQEREKEIRLKTRFGDRETGVKIQNKVFDVFLQLCPLCISKLLTLLQL